MATVLRYKVFSMLRNASRTCSFLKIKSPTNVRTLATAIQENPLKKYQQMSIHQCLLIVENKINTKGRLSGYELDCIVQAIQNKGDLRSNQVLLLIRCCGSVAINEKPEVRVEYAQKVWNTIKSSGIELDISHYNAFLKVQIENEKPISPFEYLKTVQNEGLVPNRVTYQYLLTYCCLKGDLGMATELLEEMKNKSLPLNENIFNALVMGHSVAGDISGAEGVLNIMKEKDIFITSKTYSMLLCGLAMSNNIEKMRSVFEECSKENIEIRGSKLMDIVYYLFINGHNDYAEELLNGLGEIRNFQDLVTLQYRLLHKKKFEGYLITLQFLFEERDVLDKMRLAFRYLGNKEDFETILKYKDVCDKKGLNVDVMKNTLYYSLISNNIDKSFRIIEYLHKSGDRIKNSYFAPLLIKASKDNNVGELLKIVNTMAYNYTCDMNVEFLTRNIFDHLKLTERQMMFLLGGLTVQIPSTVVFTALLRSCFERKDEECIRLVLEKCRIFMKINDDLMDSMVKYLKGGHNPVIVTDILVKWIRERNSDLNQKFSITSKSQTADSDKSLNDVQETIDKLALKVFRNCESIIAENFLNVAMRENLPISSEVVDIITGKSNDDLVKFPDSEKNEEQNRADEGAQDTDGTEESLLSVFLKHKKFGNITEMEKLFDENETLRNHFGFRKMVETLKVLNKEDLIKKYLVKYYEKFSKEGELLTKNLFLESEMINRGMLKEAVSLIGLRGPLKKSSVVVIMEVFLPLFERGNADEIKELLNIRNFYDGELLNLQYVIDLLAERGSEEVALKILRCLNEEDITALHLNKNLIPALFNKKKVQLMEELIKFLEENSATKKYGSQLLFLYACTGNIGKGRELLDSEPFAPLQWMRYISAINEDCRAQVLENAIAILKGYESFHKGKVYEYLMVKYELDSVRPEKALDLWLQLQEDNVQPSSKFLYTLSQILTKNGREVPFQVPSVVESVKVFIPQSFPWEIKEAIWRSKGKNPQPNMSRLAILILENKLHEDHITTLLKRNENLDSRLKKSFSTILSYIEWKRAFDSGALMDYLQKFIDNLNDKAPENIIRELPVGFLVCLLVSHPGMLPHQVSQIVLWAHLQNHPEYSRLVEILEPSVQELIKSEAVLQKFLKLYGKEPLTPNAKRIITYLLSQNVFDEYSDLKQLAENALNSTGTQGEVVGSEDFDSEDKDFSFRSVLQKQTEVENIPQSEKLESADIAEVEKRTSEAAPNL